jgi:hypothetical protein
MHGHHQALLCRPDAARPPISEALVSNKPLSLQLLFPDKLDLEPAAVTRSLRAYHPTMARASCELDAQTSKNGTRSAFSTG